jgi:hypothetical protein
MGSPAARVPGRDRRRAGHDALEFGDVAANAWRPAVT